MTTTATTSTLLTAPTSTDPRHALRLSQSAPTHLSTHIPALPFPLSLILPAPETQEKWQITANIFLACLRTGDSASAHTCLEHLTTRFGTTNERVLAFQALYQEATVKSEKELEECLKRLDDVVKEDETLFALRKRRAALLRSLGRPAEAAKALVELLDASPTDAETWAELADVYLAQGWHEQAVFCLEEVLLVVPNAWNMQARLGEVLVLGARKMEGAERLKGLAEAERRFCRSVELCEGYLRGFYGLKLTTDELIPLLPTTPTTSKSSKQASADTDLPLPSLHTVQKLNQLATSRLAEILRRGKVQEPGWDGYSEAELIAVKALLDESGGEVAR